MCKQAHERARLCIYVCVGAGRGGGSSTLYDPNPFSGFLFINFTNYMVCLKDSSRLTDRNRNYVNQNLIPV